jgi:GTP-binding protein HflX
MPDAVVLCPWIQGKAPIAEDMLDYKEREAVALAETLGLKVKHRETVRITRPSPSTYIGSGLVERLKPLTEGGETVLVMNCAISPVQQRNLERALQCKTIDRTALILEIFAARASTSEGKLQVELAALEYEKTRLVRSWTHLERQRGGSGGRGFLGGPGETQIESDRRAIRERIGLIRRKLEKVVNTRGLHRSARKKVPYPVVALAGYTNAGKSTLFNAVTQSDVLAEDKLFATLDPSLRMAKLPSGRRALLADTVGFISDLPTELVAAFRATLEEVALADVILHVRDISCPMATDQKADVEAVLDQILPPEEREGRVVEALNKADLLPPEQRDVLFLHENDKDVPAVAVSALTGEGISRLLAAVDAVLAKSETEYRVAFPCEDGAFRAFLCRNASVHGIRAEGEACVAYAGMTEKQYGRVRKYAEGRGVGIRTAG